MDPNPPLKNIRILDLSRLLPGPYATQLLADLGAEVIKVETPLLGDYAREAPPEFGGSAMFSMINRGKKSIALNYRNKRGREVFLRLAERCDVIVETFKPGSVERWGIAYQQVRERNPGVVYCSISGYGQSGPLRDRVGHDINYIALSGLLGLTGEAGGPPVPPAVQVADLAGATQAVVAILAALLKRQHSGEGQYLDIAMLDAAVHWMQPTAGALAHSGISPQRGAMPLTGGSPCNNVYATRDGKYLALGALEPPFWREFCALVERPDLIPHAFDRDYVAETAAIFRRRTQAGWLEAFAKKEVPLDPVLSLEEAIDHPQIVHRGLASTEEVRLGSLFPYGEAQREAPARGQDTFEVLSQAGFSAGEIEEMAASRLILLAED